MKAQTPSDRYEIHVEGDLPADWQDYLDGFMLVGQENGACTLWGQVADQSALLGILESLMQMELLVLSVRPLKDWGADSRA